MKSFKKMAAILFLGVALTSVNPALAQTVKDTSSTTKPNGAGAGNGASQGSPGAATVSGTGSGTLADSNSIASGDSGVKKMDASSTGKTGSAGCGNWGLLGLLGLLGLFGLKKNSART